MKKILLFALTGMMALAFTACKTQNGPDEPRKPEAGGDKNFPQKHLIEEFTGQGCGYCPMGMDYVHDFMKNDTNWVLLMHHYGYAPDHFSVAGSKTITNTLKVNGAPTITIDRAKTNTTDGDEVLLHPAYLETVSKRQFADSTYASVNIKNTYDASSGMVTVLVSGYIGKAEHPDLMLTVIIKESGMVDTQSDYYNTFEGWAEFRHANAVRAFLSDAKGDTVIEDKTTRIYSKEYTFFLDEKWVAENCMVVAVLSEQFQPVIQVEQSPVVSGSKGGADILHGGIKAVEVPDYYPEPNATDGPAKFSGNKGEEMTSAEASYTAYPQQGINYWQIMAYSETPVTVNKVQCVPFAYIYLFTGINETSLPKGTFELNTSEQPGTAYAGFRDNEHAQIGGSSFYFANYSYFQQGYLVPEAEWLIASGTLTIEQTGWKLNGKTLNGADIHLTGKSSIIFSGKTPAPGRKNSLSKDIPVPLFDKNNYSEQCISIAE